MRQRERLLDDVAVDEFVLRRDEIFHFVESARRPAERERLIKHLAQRVLRAHAGDHAIDGCLEGLDVGARAHRLGRCLAALAAASLIALARIGCVHNDIALGEFLVARRNLELRQRLVFQAHEDPLHG